MGSRKPPGVARASKDVALIAAPRPKKMLREVTVQGLGISSYRCR
jgi:hypothetical protein